MFAQNSSTFRCPRSHALYPLDDCRQGRYCDVCNRNYRQSYLHCPYCDYDICSECQQQHIVSTQRRKINSTDLHCGICRNALDRNALDNIWGSINRHCDICWRNNLESSLNCTACDYDVCKSCQQHYFCAKSENSQIKTGKGGSQSEKEPKKFNPGELNLVLLGPSGAGKSSLVNLFYLWANQIQTQDLSQIERVPIKTTYFDGNDSFEKNIFNPQESCTQSVSSYSFLMKNTNYKLQFLDTPGIGDTRGISQDDENILEICESIHNIGNVSAIFLVFNGSETRLSSRLQYVFKKIEGILSDDLLSNVFVLFTHVNSKPNFSSDLFQPLGIGRDKIFTLNNQAFTLSKEDLRSEKTFKRFSISFRDCFDVLTDLFDRVTQLKPKPTGLFKEIKVNRIKLHYYCEKFHNRVEDDQKTLNDLTGVLSREHLKFLMKKQYEYSLLVIRTKRTQDQNRGDLIIKKIQRRAAKIKKACSRFDLAKEIEKIDSVLEEEMMVLTALKSEKGVSFDDKTLSALKERRKEMQILSKAL